MARRDASIGITFFGRDASASATMKKLGNNAETTQKKMQEFGKKSAKAIAAVAVAAAGAAVAIGVDAVKAAIEDEKSARVLAKTLGNVTNATKAQVAAVEDYISKTSLALGIQDDKLRPAYARIVRSTKNATEAQKLLNLSLDISSATGKDVETVAAAIGKAYDGNSASLGRLGLGVDSAILKSKDFNKIYGSLRENFKGFAEQEANTNEGKLRRLAVAMDEMREGIGYLLLPIFEKLVSVMQFLQPIIDNKIMPALQKFFGELEKSKGIETAFGKIQVVIARFGEYFQAEILPRLEAFWGWIQTVLVPGIKSFLGPIIEGLQNAFGSIGKAIEDNREQIDAFAGAIVTVATWIVQNVFPVLGQLGKFLLEVVGERIAKIIGLFGTLVDFFRSEQFKAIANTFTAPFRAAFSWVAKAWNATLGGMEFSIPDWLPIPGAGHTWTLPKLPESIPALAKGGIVRQPTMALIGEAGPEAVVPLGKGMGGGMVVNVHVAGSVIRERDLAVRVRDEMAQMLRRRGLDPAVLGV